MKGKNVIIIVLLGFFVMACGSSKNLGKKNSSIDYTYIQNFHEAVRLKIQGSYPEAVSAFQKCLNQRSDDDAVHYALSQLYLAQGDHVKSAEHIRRAEELDPENIWYTQELAYMLYETGKFEEASKAFKKMTLHEPHNPDWLYGYAESLVRINKTQEAIDVLNKTEDEIGINPSLSIEKYNLYLKLKKEDAALNELKVAHEAYPSEPQLLAMMVDHYFRNKDEEKGIKMLKELVEKDPNNGRARLALADIYRRKGQKQDAYEQLQAAFKSEEVDLDTKMKILIGVLDNEPTIDPTLYKMVDDLVLMYPDEAKAHSIQGDYALRRNDEKGALKAYRNALNYDKNQYPIWNQVLILEYQMGKFDLLYEDSKECIDYFPVVPTVYLLNGVGAVQLKKYDEAVDVLESGKGLVVKDPAMSAEFYGQLGEAHFGLKQFEKAQENYDKALSLDVKSTLLMNNYAYRLALNKLDLDKAEELIVKALNIAPNQAHFIDTKGWVLFQKSNFSEAMGLFQKANELSPNDKVIVEHLGDAEFKNGNKTKALEHWKKAKELGSTNKSLDRKIEEGKYYDPQF